MVMLGLVLLSATSIVLLEKLNITNFYSSDSSIESSDTTPKINPANTVDYSPAKESDNILVPEKDINTTPNPVNPGLAATITSTRISSDGTQYLVKVAVAGTEAGSCALTMTQGSTTLSAASDIGITNNQYSCTDLRIPYPSLSKGTWQIEVVVTDQSGATVSAKTEAVL